MWPYANTSTGFHRSLQSPKPTILKRRATVFIVYRTNIKCYLEIEVGCSLRS
jgi:hypothetical protein